MLREVPFRHICIDNFLEREQIKLAHDYFPEPESEVWKTPENKHTKGKSVLRGDKYLQFAPEVRPVFDYLNSSLLLERLRYFFGIDGLVGDPYFAESGFHRIGSGGFLDIHADFSHHDFTGLERRLNLILYLNKDWQTHNWGGELKLYDEELRWRAAFEPIYNRAVIFETSETSYHGHPEPLTCPEDEFRKSIAMYYYTLPRPERKKKLAYFPTDPSFAYTGR